MQASLRKVLIDSHVAAIAIAILLFSSLIAAGLALWGPANGVLYFLAKEAAGKPPFAHPNLDDATRYLLSEELQNLPVTLSILVEALAAGTAVRRLPCRHYESPGCRADIGPGQSWGRS